MFPDLSDSLSALSGTAFVTAITYFAAKLTHARWPKIAAKVTSQTCNDVRITNTAVSVWRASGRGNELPIFEFSIYTVWKKRKK
jgi:hypothetical protein